tara:strand:+ start:93 stop:512 length:420 start_codon:yes stop_codon:yes gene_type:complete
MTQKITYKGKYDFEGIIVIPIITVFAAWVCSIAFSIFVSLLILIIGLAAILQDIKKVVIKNNKLTVVRPWTRKEYKLNDLKSLTYYFNGELRFARPLLLFDFKDGKRIKTKESRYNLIEQLLKAVDNSDFSIETKRMTK